MPIKVTIWNEFKGEKDEPKVASIYPKGIHAALAEVLKCDDFEIRTATQEEPSHGLTDEVLENTDVLLWWGHQTHHLVDDEIVKKVTDRVLKGMGFIALHSSHMSKPFTRLMGTSGSLRWRQVGEKQRLWKIEPNHPITRGIGDFIELEHEEMYGERFDIPTPDELVFISWYAGGDVFRSGCCFNRGNGKVFYFQPGHEEFPTYYNPEIIKVLKNAINWAYNPNKLPNLDCPCVEPLEQIEKF